MILRYSVRFCSQIDFCCVFDNVSMLQLDEMLLESNISLPFFPLQDLRVDMDNDGKLFVISLYEGKVPKGPKISRLLNGILYFRFTFSFCLK